MSPHHLLRSVVAGATLLALALAAHAATPAAGTKATKAGAKNTVNFERAKQQIDTLLTQRQKPTALPDPLPNPFQVADAPAAPVPEKDGKPAADPLPASSDSEMLLYYAAGLRISGTVTIEGRTHLVINQTPYKEGDSFTLKTKDGPVKLRVLGIAPGEVTLGLNEAVQAIKFKK